MKALRLHHLAIVFMLIWMQGCATASGGFTATRITKPVTPALDVRPFVGWTFHFDDASYDLYVVRNRELATTRYLPAYYNDSGVTYYLRNQDHPRWGTTTVLLLHTEEGCFGSGKVARGVLEPHGKGWRIMPLPSWVPPGFSLEIPVYKAISDASR